MIVIFSCFFQGDRTLLRLENAELADFTNKPPPLIQALLNSIGKLLPSYNVYNPIFLFFGVKASESSLVFPSCKYIALEAKECLHDTAILNEWADKFFKA